MTITREELKRVITVGNDRTLSRYGVRLDTIAYSITKGNHYKRDRCNYCGKLINQNEPQIDTREYGKDVKRPSLLQYYHGVCFIRRCKQVVKTLLGEAKDLFEVVHNLEKMYSDGELKTTSVIEDEPC